MARPLVGMISRMVDQKGFDLVAETAGQLPALDASFVVLGTGHWPERSGFLGLLGVVVAAMVLGAIAATWALRRPAPQSALVPTATPATTPARVAAAAPPSPTASAPVASSSARKTPAAATAEPPTPAPAPSQPSPSQAPSEMPPVQAPASPAPPEVVATASTPAPRPAIRLTAIGERDGQRVAILNDRLVREGDSFDGISVLRIGAGEVEVEVDGRRLTISF